MTTVTRPALLSSVAYIMQAAGITLAELAQHLGQQREQRLLAALPVEPGVDIDAVHHRKPAAGLVSNNTAPKLPAAARRLSPQAEHVLALADRPEGVTIADVCAELGVHEPTGHRHCQRLADELHLLTRVKLPGCREHRFFARPAHAATYVDTSRAQQAEPAPAVVPQPVAAVESPPPAAPPAPQPAPSRVALSDAEVRGLEIAEKKRQGARKAPPPLGARTQTIVTPRADHAPLRPVGAAVETEATRRVIDTTKRPNSRIEAAPALPPDPRWPSFSSAPLGVNPDTGRPWA